MIAPSLAAAFLVSEVGTSAVIAYKAPTIQAVISQSSAVSRVSESSGLCPSRRVAGLFWSVNDSNNPAVLHAISLSGAVGTPVTVTGSGVSNTDWEDLQSFRADGKSWLMIADTGDNGLSRGSLALYLMEEPVPAVTTVAITARQVLNLPDGERNIEAVGVDPVARVVLMADKNTTGMAEVYQLPLGFTAGTFSPVKIGQLTTRSGSTGRITGMTISPDGMRAIFISAADCYQVFRKSYASWGEALTSGAARFTPPPSTAGSASNPGWSRGEAVCFGDGTLDLFLTSEENGTDYVPLWRINAP